MHASRHPVMGVVFLAAFVLCVLALPSRPPDDSWVVGWTSRQYRAVEALVTGKRARPMVNIGVRREFAWIYLRIEAGEAHEVALEEMSGDEVMALPEKYPGSEFVRVGYVHEVHRKGLWFPWWERWLVNVSPEYTYEPKRRLEGATLRTALDAAARVVTQSPRVRAAIVQDGDAGSRVLWGRVGLNTLSLAMLVLFVHAIVGFRRWRGQKQWVRGACPGCAYMLTGVQDRAGVVTCPECGVTSPVAGVGVKTAPR